MIDFLQNYYFLLLLPVIPVPLVKRKGFGRHLKENRIYYAIGTFCVGGVSILRQAPDVDGVQRIYYFLIFIGANFATAIAVWRGFQSDQQINQFERQIQDSRLVRQATRFEKAVDMVTDSGTDPGSLARRGSGFLTLKQIFLTSGGDFDDLMEENINVLTHIITQNFQMKDQQLTLAEELYKENRTAYSDKSKDANRLFAGAQKPLIDKIALELCSGIANRGKQDDKNEKKREGEITPSAFNYIANDGEYALFIFPGIDLRNLEIFLLLDDGQVLRSEKEKQPNFKGCLIMRTEMRGATVSYVDFSESDLLRINYIGQEDSNMSCIGTRFDLANLIDCNFRGADFKDASFLGTNISGSDFRRATHLTPEQFLRSAYWIEPATPRFPSYFPLGFAKTLPNQAPL